MQKQKQPCFLDIVKKIHCPKHNQPIVLVCIQPQCQQAERTFCFQCNDEAQLNKSTHVLISTKKFDSMFKEYRNNLKLDASKEPHERLRQVKESVMNKFSEIEALLTQANEEEFVQGEQQQIMKGKLNNLFKNNIWTQILEMKSSEISQSKLYASLNKSTEDKNKIALQGLTILQKSLTLQLQSLITSLRTNKINPNKQQHFFSSEGKNTNLKLSKDRRSILNTSEYGHYFCLTEKDFDIYNCEFRFSIGKMVPNVSYWFGFTFPSLSQNKKWTNIYDQGKGGFFIVVYEDGKKVNFWNHQKIGFSTAEELNVTVTNYNSIRLRINFQSKDLEFYVENQFKKQLVKSIKPQKWYGKIFPAVGFYGKDGTISIQ